MSGDHGHGQFSWRELQSPDPHRSLAFLGEVLGYRSERVPMDDGAAYELLTFEREPVAGLVKSPSRGARAAWSLCVSVADVDASVTKAAAAGAQIRTPPGDVGGMGRYAGFADPTGGALAVWKARRGQRLQGVHAGVGRRFWQTLVASDIARATWFYETVFGWTRRPLDGAPSTTTLHAANTPVASVMQAPPGVPTHWLTCVRVESLTDAQGRVEKYGGKVLVARIDVPNVGPIGVIEDNVGAVLGLFGAAP